MDRKERKPHFSIIDPLMDSSESLWAEYLRGYHRGIEAQVFGVSEEWIGEHRVLIGYSIGDSGDPYVDSYSRGYRHGFEGRTPESPSLYSESSESLNVASIG